MECANRGIPLLLVALPDDHLYDTARTIRRQTGVSVHTLGLDLSSAGAAVQVADWVEGEDFPLRYLINNVGFGRSGLFTSVDIDEYASMLQLNNQLLVELTYRLLPRLQSCRQSAIMNVSSMEASLPIPYKAVYTATKHFVYAFSLALREEQAGRWPSISVLCPGPILTNEDGLKRIEAQGARSRLLLKMPADIAPMAVDGMLRGKGVIVPGRLTRLVFNLGRIFPTASKMRILEKVFRSYRQGPAERSEAVRAKEMVRS